ncbi:MAG: hypothetical protein ACKVQS_02225 [Fimbriimonadaceae bacterium]
MKRELFVQVLISIVAYFFSSILVRVPASIFLDRGFLINSPVNLVIFGIVAVPILVFQVRKEVRVPWWLFLYGAAVGLLMFLQPVMVVRADARTIQIGLLAAWHECGAIIASFYVYKMLDRIIRAVRDMDAID